MNIDQRLKEVIANVAKHDIDINIINEKTVLTLDLGYDSVQIIELIVELENEFNIQIDDDDLEIENLTIYKRLRKMIEEKVKG